MPFFISFQSLEGASHHVYTDQYEKFNKEVKKACRITRTSMQEANSS